MSSSSDADLGGELLAIPRDCVCAITQELMQDPVVVADGNSYERVAIETWLARGSRTSPLTNELLPHTTLTPNLALRKVISDLEARMPRIQREQLEQRHAHRDLQQVVEDITERHGSGKDKVPEAFLPTPSFTADLQPSAPTLGADLGSVRHLQEPGQLKRETSWASNASAMQAQAFVQADVSCSSCDGTGKLLGDACPVCDGSGKLDNDDEVASQEEYVGSTLSSALASSGLGVFQNAFVDNGWDEVSQLPTMTDEDLAELGLKAGHRSKFRQAFPKPTGEANDQALAASASSLQALGGSLGPLPPAVPNGYTAAAEAPAAAPAPPAAPAMSPERAALFVALFGDKLQHRDGDISVEAALAGKETVGIYFSAHWCPPCRAFTPELAQSFKQSLRFKGLEIVFVSSDRSESDFQSYHKEMPWLAVPFSRRDVHQALKDKFKVPGIPTLVILDKAGQVITTEGRSNVSADPSGLAFPWMPTPLADAICNSSVVGNGAIAGKTFEEAVAAAALPSAASVSSWQEAAAPGDEDRQHLLAGELEGASGSAHRSHAAACPADVPAAESCQTCEDVDEIVQLQARLSELGAAPTRSSGWLGQFPPVRAISGVSMPAAGVEVHDTTTFFGIDVTPHGGGPSWRVKHRYSEFSALREVLGGDFPFPRKTTLSCTGAKLDARRSELEAWLQKQCTHEQSQHAQFGPQVPMSGTLSDFLEGGEAAAAMRAERETTEVAVRTKAEAEAAAKKQGGGLMKWLCV